MSGLCGLIDFGAGFRGKKLASLIAQMQRAMIHRGFEGESGWTNSQTQVALSDCHLLTSQTATLANSGAQIQIVYDGDSLASARGDAPESNPHSPALTELARVFEDPTKSPIAALRAIETPFALALWNDRLKKLLLARDFFNAKPLYFATGRGWFAFASELRALKVIPGFDATLDPDAIAEYLLVGGVVAPRSIYKGAQKVCPGGFVELDCAALMASASLTSIRESDPAASGVMTVLAPMCPELHSSIFHNTHNEHDSEFSQPPRARTNLAQLTLAEQSELLRRALLESLQQTRFHSSSAYVMRTNTPIDTILAAMCRLELQLETHMCAVTDPFYADNAALFSDISRQISASEHDGEPLDDFSELLNRVASALDEPIGSLDSLSLNATAAFTRMNFSHALCGTSVGATARTTPTELIADTSQRRNFGNAAASPVELLRSDHALLNQICAHNSLSVATPFLNQQVAALMSAPVAGLMVGHSNPFIRAKSSKQSLDINRGVLVHALRRYLPEVLITRIMHVNHVNISPRTEQSLMQLSESMLFDAQSQVGQLTNRIALRGVLASPTSTPNENLARRWSLLVLESWLRRQTA